MSEQDIQTAVNATEVEETTTNPTEGEPTDQEVDYKKKFSESSKEALRLLEEKKEMERLQAEKDAEIERLRLLAESGGSSTKLDDSEIYPGFDLLSEEQQRDIIAFKEGIKKNTLNELYNDPAIAFAKQSFNENKWEKAFHSVLTKYPELQESKDEFKNKYYNVNNVPDNIESILEDLSKVHLFDKARDLGAKDAEEKLSRIDIERSGGGDKVPTASRSLEDWQRMAEQNPAQFAKMAKEYNQDLESGKLN